MAKASLLRRAALLAGLLAVPAYSAPTGHSTTFGETDTTIEFSLKGFADAEAALKRETAERLNKPKPDSQ